MFIVKFYNAENVFIAVSPFYFKSWDAANKNGKAGISLPSCLGYRYEVMSLTEGI